MKIAILGGSFNPVHLGHLFLADTVLSAGYDRIILVPAFESPFKPGAGGALARDRLDMLAASVAGDYRIAVEDCEIRREGVSYTVDTIADIKERYQPEGKLGLVLGDDLAASFHQWRSVDTIVRETDIIIARRLAGVRENSSKGEFPYPCRNIDNPVMDISSRMVREKIRAGENWRSLVPQGARCIIEDRNLYGAVSLKDAPVLRFEETLMTLETDVRQTLSTSRFLHSRNTALLARDLCARYGLDPRTGYLAGIAHDFCKSMADTTILLMTEIENLVLSALEKEKPSLLHGWAAAFLLRSSYGITSPEILEAVRWHVTGNAEAGPLAKIIFIADKVEVSRHWVDPGLREMCFTADLDELFLAVQNYAAGFINSSSSETAGAAQKPSVKIPEENP